MTIHFLLVKSRKVPTVPLSLLTVPLQLTSDLTSDWARFTKSLIKAIKKIGSSRAQQ